MIFIALKIYNYGLIPFSINYSHIFYIMEGWLNKIKVDKVDL